MLLRVNIIQHLILLMVMGIVGWYVCYRTFIYTQINTIQRLQAQIESVTQQKMKKNAEKKFSRKSSAMVVSIIQNEIKHRHVQLLSMQRLSAHAIECRTLTTYVGGLHILDLIRTVDCDYLSIKRDSLSNLVELTFKCQW